MNTVHSLGHLHTLKIEKSKTDAKYVGNHIANNLKLRDLISVNCKLPELLEPQNTSSSQIWVAWLKTMINWNGRNAIISSYWVCLFTKFRWRLHRALRLAWITWIPFILWFSMIFKIGLNIVHGFMNATFIDDSLYQWSLTINVHSCIYEHTSCMINDHRNSYEHWSSMIIDIDYDSWRSMIVAMKCCWSYMISVDHCIISWTLPISGPSWEIG